MGAPHRAHLFFAQRFLLNANTAGTSEQRVWCARAPQPGMNVAEGVASRQAASTFVS